MPKVTANGKTFNFPDGTTTEQMGTAIDEYFTDQQSGYQPDIQQEVPDINPADVPRMPGAGYAQQKAQQIRDAQNQNIQAHNEYERSFIGDKERQRLKQEESERGLLSGIGEGLKHTVKEFDAGTKLSPDWMPKSLQDILDYRIGGDNTKSRGEVKKEIADEMAQHNERYDITKGENPVATTVGESLPYLATGAAGEKAMLSAGERLAPALRNANINLNRKLGNDAIANRIMNMPKHIPTELQEAANTIGRGTITGAAEGAAQYDSDALKGAAGALIGGGMSQLSTPLQTLRKVRNERDNAGKKLIDEMHEQGFQVTPGMRTNNKALQTEEAGIRNSDELGQEYYNQVTRPNERRMTDMAGEAIGLNLKDRDMVSQQELSSHMDNLKSEYQNLESNTTGRFEKPQYDAMGRILKDLQPTKTRNVSQQAKQRYAVVQDVFNELKRDMQFVTRGARGKFQPANFSGAKYQAMTQKLNGEIKTALNSGDQVLFGHLKDIKSHLDTAIENGMGKTKAKEWRDLNERYAMTNMLMEGGMSPSGVVDPTKLTSSVMNNTEAARTLTGKGGRIKKFQDIAKYNDVIQRQEGGSLTGLGSGENSPQRGLLKRAKDYVTSPMRNAQMGYRLNTLRYPFVGSRLSPAHGLENKTLIQAQRAIGQAQDPVGTAQEYRSKATDAWDDLKLKLGF